MQAILATQSKAPIDTLSELADAVFEALPEHSHQAMEATVASSDLNAAIESLTNTMAVLTTNIAAMRGKIEEIQNKRHRPLSRKRSGSQSNSARRSNLCWFHHRFGAHARNCESTCSWKLENCSRSR